MPHESGIPDSQTSRTIHPRSWTRFHRGHFFCMEKETAMEPKFDVKTIIVGFGFSCVPLLRELDRTGEEYLIISEKMPNPIWANLKRNGRLDFDLVSSYYTS